MDPLTARTIKRFAKVFASLERALALEVLPDHAERDAVWLRFECTAELMSKTLKRVLRERGSDAALPKDAVRAALAARIVGEADATTLLAIIDDRNRMVHDYSEEYANHLLRRIKQEYAPVLKTVLGAIQQ